MSSVFNVSRQTLDPRQIVAGIEKALPVERKSEAVRGSNGCVKALNGQLSKTSDFFMRYKKGSTNNLPCTLWMKVNEEAIDLHLISRSFSSEVGKGVFKRVKDVVSLQIFKESSKETAVPIASSVVYRVRKPVINQVLKGLDMHKKVIEGCGEKYFAVCPVILGRYIAKNGVEKMEMISPRYIGDMWEAISENFLSLSDRIDLCLDVSQGVCLLGKLTPPIVHRDLKLDNILLKKSEDGTRKRALISDFDRATHPISGNQNEKFSRHLNFLTSRGQFSVEGDAYSLAILIGESLLSDFTSIMHLNFNEENVSDRVQRQMGLGFFSLAEFKKKVSSECAKKVEEIFLGEKPVQELLLYAKTLENASDASLVKKFTFELAVFKPIFQFVLRALREEQKSKESVLKQGISVEKAAREFHPPSAEEIVQVLEKCKATHLLLEGFLEGKIEEEDLAVLEEEGKDSSVQNQRLSPNQVRDLIQSVLPSSGYDQALETAHFVENSNAYIAYVKQENFRFRFSKGVPWGSGHTLPFSGILQKGDLGISLYCIPRLDNTYGYKECHHNLKKGVSVRIPVNASLETPSVVLDFLCIRTQREYFKALNESFVMHKNLLIFAKNHIVPCPFIDLMYQGKKGMKRELYDSWSQGTLVSELSRLNVEQKIDVCLDVLAALQCLHENNYVHMNVKPENILLRFSETGGVKARLSDFLWTTQPSLTGCKGDYYYWNSSSRNGYASIESDLYGLIKVIRGAFLELPTHIKCDRNSAEQLILESIKKQYNPFMQKQIQKLFNEKMGYGEGFSRGLMLRVKSLKQEGVIEQFALKSLLFPPLFALLEKMTEADLKMEKYVQGKYLSESDWRRALALFPVPNVEEIRQVLENGKASIKKLQEEFFLCEK